MFVFRASSPAKPGRPRSTPQPASEVRDATAARTSPAEPFIDRGLPIPEAYDVDIVRAILQDPFHILIYWETRIESLQALTVGFPPLEADTFRTTLRLIDLSGYESFFEVGRRGRYWMLVYPDRHYGFEIGVRSPTQGFIPLIRSNRIHTPRGTVSTERAEDREYRLSNEQFTDLFEATGFGAKQTFEATGKDIRDEGRKSLQWEAALRKLPERLRAVLSIASAGGEITANMLEDFPEPIRSELLKLLLEGGGRIAAAGLMHYLPELLREVSSVEQEWFSSRNHPLHLAQRFMLGGTENVVLPGGQFPRPAPHRGHPDSGDQEP